MSWIEHRHGGEQFLNIFSQPKFNSTRKPGLFTCPLQAKSTEQKHENSLAWNKLSVDIVHACCVCDGLSTGRSGFPWGVILWANPPTPPLQAPGRPRACPTQRSIQGLEDAPIQKLVRLFASFHCSTNVIVQPSLPPIPKHVLTFLETCSAPCVLATLCLVCCLRCVRQFPLRPRLYLLKRGT